MNIAVDAVVKVHDDLYYVIGHDLETWEKTAVRGSASEALPVLERFKQEEVCILEIGN